MQDLESDIRRIIDRYANLIRKVILSHIFVRDDVDPQDIEQEIRIKLWKSLRKGKKIDNLPSYLKKVAYTTTIDELRRLKKQAPYRDFLTKERIFQLTEVSNRDSEHPEADDERRHNKKYIETLLKNLSPDRRKVLRLYAAGMSIDEICEICGWNRTRVRHLLYRGIDQMRRIVPSFSGNGIEP